MTNKLSRQAAVSEDDGDIAIVGMACIFPKAPDLQTFWSNITNKVDGIGEAPAGNMLHRVFDPESGANDRVYSKTGGFLETLPPFQATRFGVMPKAIDGAEPEHFIALQVAHDALVDAGFPELPINRDRTEVILGRGTYVNRGFMTAMQHSVVIDQTIRLLGELHPEHSEVELARLKEKLKEQLPPFSPETAPGLCHNVVAGIIANRLDLHGRNLVMDAACASCLLALEIAAQDLRQNICDAAIVGGVQISTHAPIHMIFSHLGALSRRDHLRPFDKDADGTMLGEGIGMVVIKRLADAVRDGHRIYAVIKGIGSSSDGRGSGLLAPRLDGEMLALKRAYRNAGLDPVTVELVEAHGTGIPLGDVTEIRALHGVFGELAAGRRRCAVGTVKSMIGHLIPAAGIAGIIKTALALYHKVLPPTLCCDEPNPELEIDKTPFYLNTEAAPWIHGRADYPRRAGGNAFGFGGINAHVVLEEYGGQRDEGIPGGDWPEELFVFSGSTRKELIAGCRQFLRWLATPQAAASSLAEMAYTVTTDLAGKTERLAIIAGDRAELEKKLDHACRLLEDPGRKQIRDRSGIFYFAEPLGSGGKIAFLFPGEGSQYVGMLADVCRHFPEARACFDLLDRAYAGQEGKELPSGFIFPPTAKHGEAEKRIMAMEGAVDAVSTANRALFKICTGLGLKPDAAVGHSSGELAALEATAAVRLTDEEEVLSYIRIGNEIIESLKKADDIPHGRLLAVGGVERRNIDEVIGASEGFLCLAMANCPHQFVLCGTDRTVTAAEAVLRPMGAICQPLPFARAYHTERFEPALKRLRPLYQRAVFQKPAVALYSCLTGDRHADDPDSIRSLALEQWVKPVRFEETVAKMYEDGIRLFLEIGPRANLTGFVGDILKGKPHCAVATNVHHRAGMRQLLFALGQLAAHGVSFAPANLFARRPARRIEMNGAWQSEKTGGITLNRQLPSLQLAGVDLSFLEKRESPSGVAVNGEPMGAILSTSGQLSGDSAPTGDPAMAAYFRTMSHFLDVQRQVMEGMYGGVGAAEPLARRATVVHEGKRSPEARSTEQPPPLAESVGPGKTPDVSKKDPAALLLKIVSERTGYPADMLALDQDMEAELGIDSIKRVEILGALAKELGDPAGDRGRALQGMRTLGEIIAMLQGNQDDHRPATDAGLSQPAEAGEVTNSVSVRTLLLQLVSERTGYPAEMLALDQDMEAELGIDSIKRVEILGALAQALGVTAEAGGELNRLRTLGEIIGYFDAQSSALTAAGHPLLDAVTVEKNGSRLRAERQLDLERDWYLRDHTLGGLVSRHDPELHALAVLPFALGLEMLAAAAAPLFPGKALAGFKEIRATGWILLANRTLSVSLLAEKDAASGGAMVRLFSGNAEKGREALKGIVLFAESRPAAPSSVPSSVCPDTPWGREGIPDELYPLVLFHGPAWQGICRIESWGRSGVQAQLQPSRPLLTPGEGSLLAAPQVLDAAGQVVGVWASHFVAEQYVIFPVAADTISFHAEMPASAIVCRTASTTERDSIRSDISLSDDSGQVVCRITGLRHKRIDMPEQLHHFRGSREVLLSRQWEVQPDVFQQTAVVSFFDGETLSFRDTDGLVMREVIAQIILSRQERQTWQKLEFPEQRKTEWLLGRLVLKESVRRLLRQSTGMDVWSADIETVVDERGKPAVHLPLSLHLDWQPEVSLAHRQGVAVAVAARLPSMGAVGIDIETLRPLDESFLQAAFTKEEMGLLRKNGEKSSSMWPLRLWCAKEAAAKALGTGLAAGPRGFRIHSLDRSTGEVQLQATSEQGETLSASTWQQDKIVGSLSILLNQRGLDEHANADKGTNSF